MCAPSFLALVSQLRGKEVFDYSDCSTPSTFRYTVEYALMDLGKSVISSSYIAYCNIVY